MGRVWKSGNPLAMARFGWRSLRSARALAENYFEGPRARALIAGLGCHSIMPLEAAGSAAVGLVLGALGHLVGWPLPEGGAGAIINALAGQLAELGGQVITGTKVQSLSDLPEARVFVLDLTPRQVVGLRITGQSTSRRRAIRRYRYGPGVFKLDWALSSPIPWRAKECLLAATVHIGGSLEEIADYERRAWTAGSGDKPFVMLAQPSLFDVTRAPPGKHTAWAYCHVANGSSSDMTAQIEAQIERFAPGFRDTILARHKSLPADLELDNPNLVGGDIGAGAQGLRRMLFGPFPGHNPYTLVAHKVFLCSAATPPGPGVHGMCGHNAALECLRNLV
jgi:phytoene dehydrogenase-like protein